MSNGKWGAALTVGIVVVFLIFGYIVHGMNVRHDEQAARLVELEGELTTCLDFEENGCNANLQKNMDAINVKLDTIGHKLMANDVVNQLRVKR